MFNNNLIERSNVMRLVSKRIARLSSLGIVIPLVIGCNNALSRNEAEKQIKQTFQLPRDEYREFSFAERKGEVAFLIWTDKEFYGTKTGDTVGYTKNRSYPKSSIFTNLENQGFITIKEERAEVDPHSAWMQRKEYEFVENYIASFTDKAKPYVQGSSVRVSTIEFGGITGIIERKEFNVAEVDYVERRTSITPFGIAYGLNEEAFNRSITFTKYDDGWRINQ
jgi:hypothetical protein